MTLGHVRHCKEGFDVPEKPLTARILNPSRAKVKESYKMLKLDEYQLPKTLAMDKKWFLALKGSAEWPDASQAPENARYRRTSSSFSDRKHRSSLRGMPLESDNSLVTLKTETDKVELMTNNLTIMEESKEHKRIKFREFPDTLEDGLALTRKLLVRHAHSQGEMANPNWILMSRDMRKEIYNSYKRSQYEI